MGLGTDPALALVSKLTDSGPPAYSQYNPYGPGPYGSNLVSRF